MKARPVRVAAEECGCGGAKSERSADLLGQTLEKSRRTESMRSIAQLRRLGLGRGEGALTSQPDPLDLVLREPLFGAVIELGDARLSCAANPGGAGTCGSRSAP